MEDMFKDLYLVQSRKAAQMSGLIGMYEGVIKGLIEGWMSNDDAKEQLDKGKARWEEIMSITVSNDNNI